MNLKHIFNTKKQYIVDVELLIGEKVQKISIPVVAYSKKDAIEIAKKETVNRIAFVSLTPKFVKYIKKS